MKTFNIAIIGAGMIGAAHASGYRVHQARLASDQHQFVLHTVCDAREDAARELAKVWGFAHVASDWQAVIADPEIDIVSVTLPNFMHAEVATAALRAGKHVLCEKPLALTAAQAAEMTALAKASKGVSGSVFNYRRIPAVAMIKQLVENGEIGTLSHLLIQYQCGYAADPLLPHSWRYTESKAGGGALHDIGAHAIDIAHFFCGDISEIVGAATDTLITHRYLPLAANAGHNHVALSDRSEKVDTDDISSCVMRFRNGCQGLFSASRVTVGMGNTLSFTLTGSRGTILFNSERPGELHIARAEREGGAFITLANQPSFPFLSDLIPVPHDGVAVGYAEGFGFMMAEFMQAVAEGKPWQKGAFSDGLAVAQVLEAIQLSSRERRPVAIAEFNQGENHV
ncbi:Gfo/Idh/MocA family oxidoreductase [Erwinia sp. INIA-01]|uniref:Gfo/Idh/MocA family protein n=1 Tax=Erwinia sp. INIA01 TaxID=2991500 RepID=UPI002223FB9E|nr:Gfo/Idh/MocA family oxidoreductase [Erwinia sp. INIA01]MCW1876026.1 Gfo/Idh/MocA family oxidoreductase [Erwinia sp. INIA01]